MKPGVNARIRAIVGAEPRESTYDAVAKALRAERERLAVALAEVDRLREAVVKWQRAAGRTDAP